MWRQLPADLVNMNFTVAGLCSSCKMAKRSLTEPHVVDPMALVIDLENCWRQDPGVDPKTWGVVVLRLVRLAGSIAGNSLSQRRLPVQMSPEQCWETLNAGEALQDSLELLQHKYVRFGQDEPRSADGIMQADQGMFRLFEGCAKATLELSLQGLDLREEAKALGTRYWMCQRCARPTSEDHAEHMSQKHPEAGLGDPVEPLHVNDLLGLAQASGKPAVTVYSAESPIFRASNQAMREWGGDRAAFDRWRAFAYLLDCELRELPRFEGIVYRAMPCTAKAAS